MQQNIATSKAARAYRELRGLITSGHLNGGEALTEAKAMRLLGLTRGPVRESLLKLEAEGMLKHRGNRRSRVISFVEEQDPAKLLMRYELRKQIEGGAAALAAKNMNGWQIDRLRGLAQRTEDCLKSGDQEGQYIAGGKFHRYLLANCGNSLLLEVWDSYHLTPPRPGTPELEESLTTSKSKQETKEPSLLVVVDAIAAHDQERAEKLMKLRVRWITEVMRRAMWRA